jgi:hypothetical protein
LESTHEDELEASSRTTKYAVRRIGFADCLSFASIAALETPASEVIGVK